MSGYKAAYSHFQPLHDRLIETITAGELQACMDDCEAGKRTHQVMKVVAGLLCSCCDGVDDIALIFCLRADFQIALEEADGLCVGTTLEVSVGDLEHELGVLLEFEGLVVECEGIVQYAYFSTTLG